MSTTTATSASRVRPTAILAIILVSYFMIILDNSIIFTGLPRIQADMSLSATGLSWVQNAYTLVFGGLLLLASPGTPVRTAPSTGTGPSPRVATPPTSS